MVRYLIEWILIKAKIIEGDRRPPLEVIKEVLPYIYVSAILINAVRYLFPEGPPKRPWHRKLRMDIKIRSRRLRRAVIGW